MIWPIDSMIPLMSRKCTEILINRLYFHFFPLDFCLGNNTLQFHSLLPLSIVDIPFNGFSRHLSQHISRLLHSTWASNVPENLIFYQQKEFSPSKIGKSFLCISLFVFKRTFLLALAWKVVLGLFLLRVKNLDTFFTSAMVQQAEC